VHQVGANGRMVLLGADGTVFKEHMENCAPCHNPNIDTTVDPTSHSFVAPIVQPLVVKEPKQNLYHTSALDS
jgi:hypothetical protein